MGATAVAHARARAEGTTLPRESYVDEGVFQADLDAVFLRGWLFAGHACEIPEPGDFFTFQIGAESVIVVRDHDGAIRCHFNVCRHRGSRILTDSCGTARALVCPYHQWTYGLDGRLAAARLMGTDFDTGGLGLRPAAVQEVAGLVFVCLAPDPPPFEPARQAIAPQLGPHGFDRAKVAARLHYEVRANWKLLIENNRECYHCRGSHPEFCLSNFDYGVDGDPRRSTTYEKVLVHESARWESLGLAPKEVSFPGGSWYRVSRLPLKEGYLTESIDGRPVAPLMGDLTSHDTGSLRVIGWPNMWAHANCDHGVTTRLTPLAAGLTAVDLCFLVRQDAVEGVDYDPERIVHVWRATSEQDWELCENNHAGVSSMAYQPGPYSPVMENSVESFVRWYTARLEAAGR